MSADLALAADPSIVERSADPGAFIIEACERAKTWLHEALEKGDIDSIAECKSQAEAIRVYTMSKQLGKDAQLSATEIVRRAERGIGVALRQGQKAGEIETTRDARVRASRTRYGLHPDNNGVEKRPYTEFVSYDDLTGNGAGILHMTDDVSDEAFDAAVAEAKAEGNLSRANVVRKARGMRQPREWIPDPADHTTEAAARRREIIRTMAAEGYSSRQISDRTGTQDDTIRRIAREMDVEIPADSVIRGTRRHDSGQIVERTVHALQGLAMGVQLVDPADLDPAQVAGWAASLTDSIRVLNRLIKTMKENAQ